MITYHVAFSHEAKFTAHFKGDLQRFATGGSVEYNAKKIEFGVSSKMISQVRRAEYDLSVTVSLLPLSNLFC